MSIPKLIFPPALIDSQTVARILNISRTRVSQLRQTVGFPKPVKLVPLRYSNAEIVAFGQATSRTDDSSTDRVMFQIPAGKAVYQGVTERFGHMVHRYLDGDTKIDFAYSFGGFLGDRRLIGNADTVVVVLGQITVSGEFWLEVYDQGGAKYDINWKEAATRIGQLVPYWDKFSSPSLNRRVHQMYRPGIGVSAEIEDPGLEETSTLWKLASSSDIELSKFATWMIGKASAAQSGEYEASDKNDSLFAEVVTRRIASGDPDNKSISIDESNHALDLFRLRADPTCAAVVRELVEHVGRYGPSPIHHDFTTDSDAIAQLRASSTPAKANSISLALLIKAGPNAEIREDVDLRATYLFSDARDGIVEIISPEFWTDHTVTEVHFHKDGAAVAVRSDGTCFYAGYQPYDYPSGALDAAGLVILASKGSFNLHGLWSMQSDNLLLAKKLSPQFLVHPATDTLVIKLDDVRKSLSS
jgi:hypothetical protein